VWTFDQPTAIAGAPTTFKANGLTPISASTDTPYSTTVSYPGPGVSPGDPWTIAASEPQATPTPAFPQSGTIA
jgi:hypothetical protein